MNSTGHSGDRGLHPRASGPSRRRWSAVGCRVDLHRTHRARLCDRPIDLLRPSTAHTLATAAPGRVAQGRDHPGARGQLQCLRGTKGVAGAESGRYPGGSLHRRATHGRTRSLRRGPREGTAHHDRRSGCASTGGSCGSPVQPLGAERVVGSGLYVCLDLVWVGVCRVRHRRLRPPHPGLA